MRSLAATSASPVAAVANGLACFPNPSNATVSFTRGAGPATALDVYDITGRRVATLEPNVGVAGLSWSWDGRDTHGARVAAGSFFARPRDGSTRALRVTRVR